VLFIDPFPYAAEMGPRYIAQAIKWALEEGWSSKYGPTRALSIKSETKEFFWLKEDSTPENVAVMNEKMGVDSWRR
jgi:hypothetical protein